MFPSRKENNSRRSIRRAFRGTSNSIGEHKSAMDAIGKASRMYGKDDFDYSAHGAAALGEDNK